MGCMVVKLEMFANGSRMPDSGCSHLALQLHNELYITHLICVVFISVVHEFSLYACLPNVKRICAATLH